MNLIGHGLDLVEVDHFDRLCVHPSAAELLTGYFTPAELSLVGDGPNRGQRLAGRFAAKEAVLKALGTGWSQDIALTDVEIRALPTGAPDIVLHGAAREVAAQQKITTWSVSITHTSTFAAASAIAWSDSRGTDREQG